ncbi:hypothetical protein HPB48_010531 [Haemaphysalis longicornis]|uniref:RWD domain-containing protein n=1 Tax=Haemaphysalis longicornis TaxID=44386 RepID=A0A9J6H3W0_HAELO|nr:hypothetical protein HPB48_010531 [Haemaphysalis longicornis]
MQSIFDSGRSLQLLCYFHLCCSSAVLETSPYHSFTIDIKSDASDHPEDEQMSVQLKFTYIPTYPDEGPLIEATEYSENMSEEDVNALMDILKQQVEENLGMVMIFTLVSAATEWLNLHREDVKTNKAEAKRLAKEEEEAAERAKFEGTRVTVECFLAWKQKFDAEMAEIRKREKTLIASGKLTGRELFEKDKNLIDSDLQFMQEGRLLRGDKSWEALESGHVKATHGKCTFYRATGLQDQLAQFKCWCFQPFSGFSCFCSALSPCETKFLHTPLLAYLPQFKEFCRLVLNNKQDFAQQKNEDDTKA